MSAFVPDSRFRPFIVPPNHPARPHLDAGRHLYLALGPETPPGGTERFEHIVMSILGRVWRLYGTCQ